MPTKRSKINKVSDRPRDMELHVADGSARAYPAPSNLSGTQQGPFHPLLARASQILLVLYPLLGSRRAEETACPPVAQGRPSSTQKILRRHTRRRVLAPTGGEHRNRQSRPSRNGSCLGVPDDGYGKDERNRVCVDLADLAYVPISTVWLGKSKENRRFIRLLLHGGHRELLHEAHRRAHGAY
ncbi:hypothetical protein U1Q18_020076 [Sarracenia purpurea var. burkii]